MAASSNNNFEVSLPKPPIQLVTLLNFSAITWQRQLVTLLQYAAYIILTGSLSQLHTINLLSSLTTDQADIMDDNSFYSVLSSHVQISSIETSPNGHICLCKTAPIDPQTLATCWMISPEERAKHTVVMTMQRGVETCLNPTLS
jgi:hypothetical protein